MYKKCHISRKFYFCWKTKTIFLLIPEKTKWFQNSCTLQPPLLLKKKKSEKATFCKISLIMKAKSTDLIYCRQLTNTAGHLQAGVTGIYSCATSRKYNQRVTTTETMFSVLGNLEFIWKPGVLDETPSLCYMLNDFYWKANWTNSRFRFWRNFKFSKVCGCRLLTSILMLLYCN